MKRSTRRPSKSLRALLLGLGAAAALLPRDALGNDTPEVELELPTGAAPELVAEALFLCDPLPPTGRDLGLAVVAVPDEPDPLTAGRPFRARPRLQLALGLGERTGLTVDVGLGGEGGAVHTPAASLKVLVRSPEAGRTGLSASVDLLGRHGSLREAEAGLGLGAIRQLGPVGLRVSATVASTVSAWSPHLHVGASAAMAFGRAWRGLVEVVAEVGPGGVALAAGPTLKVALAEGTALVMGALVPLERGGPPPVLAFQVVQAI